LPTDPSELARLGYWKSMTGAQRIAAMEAKAAAEGSGLAARFAVKGAKRTR
jgi:hypothetical protein